MRKRLLLFAPLAILAFIGFVALGGAIVSWLWNWLVPSIVGWRAVSFWEALGLLALCRILFGGLGAGGRGYGRSRRHAARGADALSDDERDRVRAGLHARFGPRPRSGDGPEPDAP